LSNYWTSAPGRWRLCSGPAPLRARERLARSARRERLARSARTGQRSAAPGLRASAASVALRGLSAWARP
jgi:hypothetical protein